MRASHPFAGEAYVAAELLVAEGVEPVSWTLIPDPYEAEVGIGSLGASDVIIDLLDMEHLMGKLEDLVVSSRPFFQTIAAESEDCVLFSVEPQHASCRSWAGFSDEGDLVRVVTDLGILESDLLANSTLPRERT